MSSNFSSLRSRSKDLLDKLAKEASKSNKPQDERFWKLATDAKTKIGSAVIRFLMSPKNEEVPWVMKYVHRFKTPTGQWIYENCPTTHNQVCPICKENSKLWATGLDADKQVARGRKRGQRYITNILVIEDPAHHENDGKVFLFEYGSTLHEKIKDALNPEFEETDPFNPFDFWEGANFRLRSRDKEGYQNYDKSVFDKAAPLFGGNDAQIEAVWEKEYPLQPFLAEKEFKTFDELADIFAKAMSDAPARPKTAEDAIKAARRDEDKDKETPNREDASKAAASFADVKKRKPTKKVEPEPEPETTDDENTDDDATEDGDEVAKFFASLDKE